MHSSLIALYVIVAGVFFVVGKATTPTEVRNGSLAALASLLWPLSCIAVVVCVVYEKWKFARMAQACGVRLRASHPTARQTARRAEP